MELDAGEAAPSRRLGAASTQDLRSKTAFGGRHRVTRPTESMTALEAILLLQLGQGIVVETDSPDAHCPDLHQTRAAVSARLGAVQSQGFRARYTIVHARGEIPRDFVLLELLSPEGDVRLRRELPIDESCAAVADAIALVLDQYFRALIPTEATDPGVASTPADNETSAPTNASPSGGANNAIAPRAIAAPPAAPAPPAKSARPRRGFRPSVAAMLEATARSFPTSAAAGLRVEALFTNSWHAGLELSIPLSERSETLRAGGEARARSIALNAHLGWGPQLGELRPYLGPTLFTLIERGHTTSPLTSNTQYRWLAGAGGEFGISVRLRERWRTVGFASVGRIFAQSARFLVRDDEVLNGITWLGQVGLGVAYAF